MITDALITLVNTIVGFFDSLLPLFTAPSWFTGSGLTVTVAQWIGSALAPMNQFLPVDAILNVLMTLFVLLPFIAAYTVFQWVWDHVPTIAGFGTGNG